MAAKTMDSLDLVEAVVLVEGIFGPKLPDGDAKNFEGPRQMVDWLELRCCNRRPNKEAAVFLRKLAKAQDNPELAQGLEGTWRREQIAAVVREIFHKKNQ
jgi:hypothetical protein